VQALTLDDAAAWLLPALLERGASALPALSSLTLEAQNAPAVMRRLFADRGLLPRLTRLRVFDSHRLPPLPGAPDFEHCRGGMLMEDLEFEVRAPVADAAKLAAWPMPRLRRLALEEVDRATLRALLRAPWAAGLQDLDLRTFEGAFGGAVGYNQPPCEARQLPLRRGQYWGSTRAKAPRLRLPCLAPNPVTRPRLPCTSGADELARARGYWPRRGRRGCAALRY
jgi:hypothetical protein